MIIIGIDPGTKTGIAVWNIKERKFLNIETTTITKAMDLIKQINDITLVRIEDARLRRWFKPGEDLAAKKEGAGSVKRDSKIWEDFCKEQGYKYQMVAPKNNRTKLSSDFFHKITGLKIRTSEHARDAAMLVYNFNENFIKLL